MFFSKSREHSIGAISDRFYYVKQVIIRGGFQFLLSIIKFTSDATLGMRTKIYVGSGGIYYI